MTHRDTLHALIAADMKREPSHEDTLLCSEFEAICNALIGREYDRDLLLTLTIRNRETDGAFLTDDEETALLHVINGGNLDDALGTDTRCMAANHHGGGESVVLLPGNDSGA